MLSTIHGITYSVNNYFLFISLDKFYFQYIIKHMTKRRFITVSEAARRKGVSRQAIHYAIQKGKLEAEASTVEAVEWKVCPRSLAKLVINTNMQGRAGRPKGNGK